MQEKYSDILKHYGDYSELHVQKVKLTSIRFRGKELDNISINESFKASVRVYYKGGWGFVSFTPLGSIDANILKSKLEEALKYAKYIPQSDGGIYLDEINNDTIKTDCEIDVRDITISDKVNLTRSYNSIMLSLPNIINTTTIYRDMIIEKVFANSIGSNIDYDLMFCGMGYGAYSHSNNGVEMVYDSVGNYGGFEIVNNIQDKIENIAKLAGDMVNAQNINGGKYNVVIDNKLAGVFAHEAFGHLSEADAIYENERFKEIMRIGREFGSDELNIIDDGNIKEAGYTPYDDEGIRARKTYLIKDGILSGRLHSRETAYIMGEKVSGNARAISPAFAPIVRMTNTYIDNGRHKTEDLFDIIGDGIYACGFMGGMTDLEMFTFSANYGYEIKNGKIGKMLKNITLSGNVFYTLKNIVAIGNDLMLFGGLGGCGKKGQSPLPVSDGSPHLAIKDVVIGGR